MNRRERFSRRGNLAKRAPDKPPVVIENFWGGLGVEKADRLTVEVVVPLTEPRVVRGHTIGGGTSNRAIRRAREHLAKR